MLSSGNTPGAEHQSGLFLLSLMAPVIQERALSQGRKPKATGQTAWVPQTHSLEHGIWDNLNLYFQALVAHAWLQNKPSYSLGGES